MKKKQEKWRSPSLGRDMQIRVYGEEGTPILALPTRGGKCGQWEEFSMTGAISLQLKEGYNKLYCIDSIDEESFLNEKGDPEKRITRHQQFETYVVEEVVPYIRQHSDIDFLIVAGVDLGGYHAVNLALKYPKEFGKVIGISGIYDIKSFMGDYYSDHVYYNNPVDYIPNLNKASILDSINSMDIRLVSYTHDEREGDARRMSDVLQMKFIEHKLDIWEMPGEDEWSLWKEMLETHII